MSLRTKVFLPLLILMALLIGYLYWYWMPRSLANMERQYQEATERHLDSVVEGVIPLLLGRQLDNIYENFDALLKKNSDWISIRLTDAAGRPLYPLENTPATEFAAQAQNVRVLTKRITYLDMYLGTLSVAVDLTPRLTDWMLEFRSAVLVMLGTVAVIVLSIGIVLERKVVRPVKALEGAARELAKGRFDAQHLKAGDDEVGHLVDSFTAMRENLASSYNLLVQSEQKNRIITSTARDAIIMMDDDGRVLFWNPAAETIFGYGEEEMLGRELHDIIVPESYRETFRRGMEKFRETGAGAAVGQMTEMNARRKDDTEFPVALSLSAFQMNKRWHAVGIVRDMTQRKLAEDRILASLAEKELLLEEIHHRVKNNLQIIASLLDLQLGYVAGREPQEVFREIKNRVKSMALVHEKLYLSKDLSKVDFHDYLTSLINNLYRSYSVNSAKIALKLEVEDVFLGIDTAIPCGLIVNELIANAFKYAFPGERAGEVHVMLGRSEDERGEGVYELSVKDNGVGIPQDVDMKGSKTLGLSLVTTLVEHQLRGSIDVKREGGTKFYIRFKEQRRRRRT